MDNLKTKLSQLKKKYRKKYGLAIFDVKIIGTGLKPIRKKGLIIKGIVLTKNQRDKILDLVKFVDLAGTGLKPIPATIKIKILSDPKQRNEIGWAMAKNKTIDLKSRFVSNKIVRMGFKPVSAGRILKRIRCSQIFRNEILRILYEKEDQLLIQQRDGTLGWVDRKEVIIKRKDLYQEWIKKFHTLEYGTGNKILAANVGKDKKDKIIQEAEKYLGAPYLLGGKTKKGIDCSGLVQIAYQNSLGIILPRHSRDQRKLGRKIKLKNSEAGDLVFFEKLKNKTSHVGLVYENKLDEILIIHSCRDNKRVRIQELRGVLERYRVMEVRRVVGN